jgi:tetratricopeptide (TPR) repeat protein
MEGTMKKKLALLFLICMAGTAVAQDQMADLLRKAIVEEEANQELDKAITAYIAILEQYDKQRVTAATALFHLADCYRKQGIDEKAIDAYQRVMRDFPEQTEFADASRNYLASVYNIQTQQNIEAEMRKKEGRAIQELRLSLAEEKKKDMDLRAAELRLEEERKNEDARKIKEAVMQVEIEAFNKKLDILKQKIDIKERQIRETEKRVEAGVASPSELYSLRTELLSLQERLTDMQYQMEIYKIRN